MTDSSSQGLTDAIAAIWRKHRELMFTRLATIEAALRAAEDGSLDDSMCAEAHREAHKLAGALGTFGLHEGSAAARNIETSLGAGAPYDHEGLNAAAAALRKALESRPAS